MPSSAVFHYFIASLPRLVFGEQPPFSSEEFRELCQEHTSEKIARIIGNANMYGQDADEPVLSEWYDWERDLRNELARRRAERAAVSPDPFMRNYIPHSRCARLVAGAPWSSSPEEFENYLDRARWSRLDELEFGAYFDARFLILYALRLRILERWAGFQEVRGIARVRDIMRHAAERARRELRADR